MKTAYDILGVPRHADDEAIRAAYRRAAKVHHPDLNAGDKVAEQSFRQLAAAYEVLKDPQQRDAYDVSLRKRRFGKTASVLAGLICGAGLAAMVLLSKTLGPLPQPQSRQVVLTKAIEPRDVAALDDVGRQTEANERVASGAATSAELHDDQPRHLEQLANKEEASAAGLDVATPLSSITSQLKQEPEKRGTMEFWVSIVRNPEAFKDKPGRSELLQAIDTGDDARLLRALSMGADQPIAERARRRLIHMAKAIMMQDAEDGEGAGSLGSKEEATPSSDAAFYLTRSGLHFRRGNFDQAITDCDEAIRLEPGKAHAYGQRGKAWAGKGDTDRALADYDAAIHLDPHNANLLREQGGCGAS
jgi:tetratricopeptide (TPR) repeat protein